eukprot:scaffold115225_cov51-Phaeocystis_antarctica.AAC.1
MRGLELWRVGPAAARTARSTCGRASPFRSCCRRRTVVKRLYSSATASGVTPPGAVAVALLGSSTSKPCSSSHSTTGIAPPIAAKWSAV